MSEEQPSEADFPDDAPATLRELTNPEYEEHALQRVHRNVSEEPIGGAIWLSETEAVRVMKYKESWSVEVPPVEMKVPSYASDDADELLHFIEYEMDAEHGLTEREAYELADSYMRGDAELTEDAWWVGKNDQETGQQTLSDISAS